MWKRRLTLPALLALVLVGLTACGGDGSGGSPDEEAAAAQQAGMVSTTSTTAPVATAPSLIVTARDYAFEDLPPEIEGGVLRMTFVNDGERRHSAMIVATGDTPLEQVTRDLAPVVNGEGKAIPDYLRFHGGVSLIEGGTSWAGTVSLPPGKYAMVCPLTDADTLDPASGPPDPTTPRHFERGMAATFRVDSTNTAVMPPTDGPTVVARDWSYEVPPLPPGLKTLTFRNDGAEHHSLAIGEFPVGMDPAAAKADPTRADDVAVVDLSPGGAVTVSLRFKVNRTYVFACYLPDRSGGPLHAVGKGMATYATVPSG